MPTTYAEHLRVSAIGVMQDSSTHEDLEIFSYGFSVGLPLDAADALGTALEMTVTGGTEMAATAAAVHTFHASVGAAIAPDCILQMVKIAPIAGNGTYLGPPYEETSSTVGHGPGYLYPPQVALVVTEDGPVATHRQHGRFYVPCPTQGTDADLRISSADATALVGAAKTMVDAVNTAWSAFTGVPVVVIASQKGAGHNVIVEQLRVGRDLDTQRRRRNALAEDYVSAAV